MSNEMCNECNHCITSREAELSSPQLQNVFAGNPLYLGLAIVGGQGPSIIYDVTGNLFLNRGLYLVSYSTSAVWTTTPYGTNEAIIGLTLNNVLLADSVSQVEIPPQTTDVGPVPFKLNLAKTILVRVTSNYSRLKLVNESNQVMGFVNTVLTLVKLD
ncbi:hypothetical protein [Clostridium gasigenes]|uniref:Uncharacterized protein n=1 Tax=Clostridium gasigenes TaxID=94869 RepID=A0A1H0UID1_9CLOT|nr:hypothetical protein [Clostridium gasigenes]MBB6623206.1 hypothetical protein [Clostridium gasigenes]MBU3087971.1 hypothetical protein [Clostridium gasigenes]MBU3132687.1 hypothetical protein [Clostridium gasigenes]MBU3135383.1 hypothetical protein [Clostridium gasigenes]NKF05784.1 hypothetical protein [Clostridium gasigenes]